MMKVRIQSVWMDDEGYVQVGQYRDGTLALSFVAEDGEPLCTLSTNLSGHNMTPPPGFVYVKDYSESAGLAEGMEAAGLGKCVGTVAFGAFGTTATLFEVAKEVLV